MTPYAPLWCRSNYSFLEGASHPREWISAAHALGIPSLAITDRDGVYGIVRAHLKAQELGVHLIIGATLSVDHFGDVVVLVKNNAGYVNLCKLITQGRLRSVKGESQCTLYELCEYAEGMVALAPAKRMLKEAFGSDYFVPISRHSLADDHAREIRRQIQAKRMDVPLVVANEMLYHHRSRRRLHDVITCIRHKKTIRDAGTLIKSNDEYDLKSPLEMRDLFADSMPALENTLSIAERCIFNLGDLHYRYPTEHQGSKQNSAEHLRALVHQGAVFRYPQGITSAARDQIAKELEIIESLDYGGYFLTMYEIALFCRDQDILCQGRGSAANSVVCYCLRITDVDPIQMNLLFERFISKERAEPPDIDLDIEHNRREEVIQHVYKKYGRDRAAMVCNFIRYRPKSALRDIGKVLGVPEVVLDRASKLIGWGQECDGRFFEDVSEVTRELLLSLVDEILDFPRHLSIHSGGFLLGERPVSDIVPIENASMPGRTVIQWDKEDIEALKLFKVDLLALGALHQLHRSFDLIRKHHGIAHTMATLPQEDPDTYAMMSRADTVGVFQIESRAQMSMLPRLKPKTFYDLVIEISLVRPGPITGGMVHPYLRRRCKQEEVTYPHPSLESVLARTLGVPLFQEQVMRLAMIAADYSAGEADQLRRDMAAWSSRGKIDQHRERLVSRMVGKGIETEFANRVFEQIRGFGEYGFPESHAASFALIAYATSWVKCHYPAIFACALLNSQPMGFYAPATIVWDAVRHNVRILPIDVCQSEWECIIEQHQGADVIRMGLCYVRQLPEQEGVKILEARRNRSFRDLNDFVRRSALNQSHCLNLAQAGAFACFEGSRRDAMWQAQKFCATRSDALTLGSAANKKRFKDLGSFEEVAWDVSHSSHSTHGHPLSALRPELTQKHVVSASDIAIMGPTRSLHYAGLVICRQRPPTAGGVSFLTLEDETGFVSVIIWAKVHEAYNAMLKSKNFLGVTGQLQVQEGIRHLVAQSFWLPKFSKRPDEMKSRNFH